MKLKIFNYLSAVCFLLSSVTLLFIPALDFEEGFPEPAYLLAGLFWLGLIAGIVLQIFLQLRSRKLKIKRDMRKPKLAAAVIFGLSVIAGIVVLVFFQTNSYMLPIDLFAILLSAEVFCVIKRMERIV